jgi:ATP-dependent DNA helicase RecQ
MASQWSPDPAPQWVTAVPSLRNTELVESLAVRLAGRLSLPFRPVVVKVNERPPQKLQQNGAHQQRNVEGAFSVIEPVPLTPVLLVDDLVDSTWTMTEVARLLRRAGSGPVYPVALASSAGRD